MPILTSVIIVNYNAGSVLSDCVNAVLASDAPLEIHVVDNASVDDSMAQLKQQHGEDPRLNLHFRSNNAGFAVANNQALAQACGDYFLLLNPDCFIQTNSISQFCQLMQSHPKAGMIGALVQNADGSEQASCRRRIPTPSRSLVRVLHLDKIWPKRFASQHINVNLAEALPDQVIEVEGISGACMFVRRSAWQQVGGLDERYFLHCEDLDWFMRFHAADWQILFSPYIIVKHLHGWCSQQQPIRILWYKHQSMIIFYRKFFRKRYPLPLWWLVKLSVWARFGVLSLLILLKLR